MRKYHINPWIEDVMLQSIERPIPNIHSLIEGSVNVDIMLNDGDVSDLEDGLSLEVIHTPGHSKGSISPLFPKEGALFSGDALPLAGDVPIYDDVLASIQSIKKLRAIEGIDVLLSSWDDPKKGDIVYNIMDGGLRYLELIRKTVIKIHVEDPSLDPMELCRRVISRFDLPEMAANPLSARSFQANLAARDMEI
jgi:hydroxyacylglutathione hydrolase